ncbi:MAG TPA: hypothetical protein GXZ47_09855 [Treponema sp.]|nr:hypothetical protein [Treponema sp.]
MSDNSDNPRRRDRRRRNKNRDTNNLSRQKDPQARSAVSGRTPRRVIVPTIPPPPKMPVPLCARCGEPIQDITSALADKNSGNPVHFDCVLLFLQGSEKIEGSQSLLYIGQGRFAVVEYTDPADKRKFTIIRVIEWEGRETRAEWRGEIAGHYSDVH